MRKVINFWSWVILLSLSVGFSSCSKDNSDTFYIKAKVNGKNYSAGVGTSVGTSLSGVDRVSVSGISLNNDPIIMISFPIDITVGTYDISDDIWYGDYQATYWDSSDNQYPSNSGSITITEYDKTKGLIKGTFQFTVDGYTITDGEFCAELP